MNLSKRTTNILRFLCILFFVLIIILPISIIVHGSLQGDGIGNYIVVLTQHNIERFFMNSSIIATMTVAVVSVLVVFAGFAFSKLHFPFKNVLYIFILSALLLPAASIMVPIFQINARFGLLNTHISLLGPYVVFIAPFTLLIAKNGFDTLPNTVLEAALIDGCSIFKAIRKIAIPMCRPSIVMVVIWTFLSSWNEFLFAFIMLREEHMMTITVIPTRFQQMYGGSMGRLFAALFIIVVPIMIVYFVLQKFIVGGLSAGSLKE
jgi:raffinose/stachyose/melibiose transport system permease protein